MRKAYFKILPGNTRYAGLSLESHHEFIGLPKGARKGEGDVMLAAVHTNGLTADLPFRWDEVEQIQSRHAEQNSLPISLGYNQD